MGHRQRNGILHRYCAPLGVGGSGIRVAEAESGGSEPPVNFFHFFPRYPDDETIADSGGSWSTCDGDIAFICDGSNVREPRLGLFCGGEIGRARGR